MRNRVFLAALAALAVSSCAPSLPKMTIVIHGIPFNVEIARTQAEREKGLMFRKSLGAREGTIVLLMLGVMTLATFGTAIYRTAWIARRLA